MREYDGYEDSQRGRLDQLHGNNTVRHPLVRSVLYTDGVQHVAETGGAYWLLDEIALAQSIQTIQAEEFQVWKLKVQDSQRMLTCDDGNGRVVYAKRIDHTDFPLPEIKL